MKLYNYKFSDDFANAMGIPEDSREDTGVIAQEIREVLPEAVKEAGDVPLGNGEVIKDFLVVNKVIMRVSHFRGGVLLMIKLSWDLDFRGYVILNLISISWRYKCKISERIVVKLCL